MEYFKLYCCSCFKRFTDCRFKKFSKKNSNSIPLKKNKEAIFNEDEGNILFYSCFEDEPESK